MCGKSSIDGLTHSGCHRVFVIDGAFCGVVYKDIVRKLLYQFKYQPYLTDLQQTLTDLLYESLIQQQAFVQALQTQPVLIPVPLSAKKLCQRGYNQAELYAKGLTNKFGLEIQQVLRRQKETKPKSGLFKDDRQENMKGVFVFGIHKSSYKTALLVDDILTTGSTLYEAVKVLKKNEFEKVWGGAFACEQ